MKPASHDPTTPAGRLALAVEAARDALDTSARTASGHAEAAVMYAEHTDWPSVLRELEAACAVERAYGTALELARDMAQAAETP